MSKYDILSLFEDVVDEAKIDTGKVYDSLSKTSEEIESLGIRAPNKSKKNKKNITSKKSNREKDQNEEDETDLDTKKSSPKDLQPKFENPEEEEDNDINLEDAHDFYSFLDRLNLFRAAGSLKDSDVIERLKDFFKNLSPGAREATFVIINSLTGIANLVVDGNSADLPSKFGINITHGTKSSKEKESNNQEDKIKYKPAKEKESKNSKPKKSKNKSSNLSPISVVPESLQDKTEILKVLNELKM